VLLLLLLVNALVLLLVVQLQLLLMGQQHAMKRCDLVGKGQQR
jgi:hypothetical protein